MTMSRLDAREMLTKLGVARWETNPPSNGVITWIGENGSVVARGKYQVILSWGPGIQYTMGWSVSAYPQMGIPFVSKELGGEPGFVGQGTRSAEQLQEEAYRRSDEVAKKMGADFAYQASTLLLAVSGFTKEGAKAKPKATPKAKPAAKAKAKPKATPKAKPAAKAKVKPATKPKPKAKPAAKKKKR